MCESLFLLPFCGMASWCPRRFSFAFVFSYGVSVWSVYTRVCIDDDDDGWDRSCTLLHTIHWAAAGIAVDGALSGVY